MRNYQKLQDVFAECKNESKNESNLNKLKFNLSQFARGEYLNETGIALVMDIYNYSLEKSYEDIQLRILSIMRYNHINNNKAASVPFKYISENINNIQVVEESLKLSFEDGSYVHLVPTIIDWLSKDKDYDKVKRLLRVFETTETHKDESTKAEKQFVDLLDNIDFGKKFFGLRFNPNWKNMSHNDCVRIKRKKRKLDK